MSFFLVFSTAGSEREGQRIGKALVKKRFAACVNVFPGITSFFPWEGKISREREVLLIIKTNRGNLHNIANEIKRLHSYSLPEVLSIKIEGGEQGYLQWMRLAMGRKGKKG